MHRREYLGLVSASTLAIVAGCSTEGTEENPNGNSNNAITPDEESESTQTPTVQEPQEASLEITKTDYTLANSVTSYQDNDIPWGIVDIENTSQAPHGATQIQVRFYDSEDALLEARQGIYINYIPMETTWRHYQRYYTETPDEVESIDARIVENTPQVAASTIDGELLNSDLQVEPESGVDFAAEVDIEETNADRISAIGLFYDDAGRLRGSIRRIIQNPQETVAISAETLTRTPPDLEEEQVTTFELLLFDGILS